MKLAQSFPRPKLVRGRSIRARFVVPVAALLSIAALAIAAVPTSVFADQYDAQIQQLQQQNADTRNNITGLQAEASSYQDAMTKLQQQIDAVQAQINDNLARQAVLQQQITANKQKLEEQRSVLRADIKAMYVSGQMSTVEMLASSKDLSDFVDAETYRHAVQNKVQTTLDEIARLQAKLNSQKQQVDDLLNDQQRQQSQLASSKAEQASLLAYNKSQQDNYNSQLAGNQAKIADLRKQQAVENARYSISSYAGDPNHGGYPIVWSNAAQDSLVDSWGMYNRECVSYTAFKVHADFLAGKNSRDMPYWGGVGNANQWDDNARSAGIPADSNPTVGSIAISNAGFYGHAMYVEQVGTMNGRQAIYVSQYNASLNGTYSEGWRYTTDLVFLHF